MYVSIACKHDIFSIPSNPRADLIRCEPFLRHWVVGQLKAELVGDGDAPPAKRQQVMQPTPESFTWWYVSLETQVFHLSSKPFRLELKSTAFHWPPACAV